MALTTKSFGNSPSEQKPDPEYEIVTDEEGRKALKKIRNVEDLKINIIPEKDESPESVKEKPKRIRKRK